MAHPRYDTCTHMHSIDYFHQPKVIYMHTIIGKEFIQIRKTLIQLFDLVTKFLFHNFDLLKDIFSIKRTINLLTYIIFGLLPVCLYIAPPTQTIILIKTDAVIYFYCKQPHGHTIFLQVLLLISNKFINSLIYHFKKLSNNFPKWFSTLAI